MLKHIKTFGVTLAILFLLLAVLFLFKAFDHHSPLLYLFASLGLFNGSAVIMFLVVIIELLKRKEDE